MKIKKIISQHRRDFKAVMECEGCGHEQQLCHGYDDSNYHQNVIPNMHCGACGKSAIQLGVDVRPIATKCPDGMQI